MKAVQRMGGKMLKRSDDQQDVLAVISEFKSIENMLERLLRDLKLWRDSWDDILKLQYDTSEAFAALYKPLEPPPDPDAQYMPRETPAAFMQKCLALQKMYSEEKGDLQQEIGLITKKVIRPVEEAKLALRGLQKTLKHRENMKLDYERYLSRAEHARKKDVRSVKDETTLAKHEGDLVQSKIDYQTADEQVVSTFPPVSQAVAGLMPYILAGQVMLQTTLVGQLYTCLDGYCRQQGMPSPAPSDVEIVGRWESEFTALRKEVESGLSLVSQGRAVNMSMSLPDKDVGSSMTGLGIRNKARSGADAGRGYLQNKKNGQAGGVPHKTSSLTMDGGGEEEDAPPKPPRPGGSNGPSPLASPYPSVNLANKPRMPSSSSVNAYAAAYDQKASPAQTPYGEKPVLSRIPSRQYQQQQQQAAPPPYEEYGGTTSPAASSYHTPRANLSPAPSTRSDYFAGAGGGVSDRKPSYTQQPAGVLATAAAAAKKKPPPPIPAKRIPSQQSPQIVTALYDFEGQNDGDLSFREGDRITVIRKTESVDDWWEGSCQGRKGSFPANYVQL